MDYIENDDRSTIYFENEANNSNNNSNNNITFKINELNNENHIELSNDFNSKQDTQKTHSFI